MNLTDYKKLTKIRIRNYVSLIMMLSKIDSSQETYNEIKTKLYQIQALTKYLDIDYTKLYERLHENKPIHDVNDKDDSEEKKDNEDEEEKKEVEEDGEKDGDEDEEKSKHSDKNSDEEDSNKDSENDDDNEDDDEEEDEDDDESENEEDAEYAEFFKHSSFNEYCREDFTHHLEREELKWLSRA